MKSGQMASRSGRYISSGKPASNRWDKNSVPATLRVGEVLLLTPDAVAG